MAVPAKKTPRRATRTRRSAWLNAFGVAKLQKCPKCATPKRPHLVCKTCGTYKGEKIIEVKHHMTRSERRAAAKAQAEKHKAEEKKPVKKKVDKEPSK